MSKDLLDGIIQGVASAVVDRFFAPDAAPDPASAPPEAPPIEVREAPRVTTSLAHTPQRFTCACGCAYEVGVDAVPLADGGTTDVLYVKAVGAAPARWVRVRPRRRAARKAKP